MADTGLKYGFVGTSFRSPKASSTKPHLSYEPTPSSNKENFLDAYRREKSKNPSSKNEDKPSTTYVTKATSLDRKNHGHSSSSSSYQKPVLGNDPLSPSSRGNLHPSLVFNSPRYDNPLLFTSSDKEKNSYKMMHMNKPSRSSQRHEEKSSTRDYSYSKQGGGSSNGGNSSGTFDKASSYNPVRITKENDKSNTSSSMTFNHTVGVPVANSSNSNSRPSNTPTAASNRNSSSTNNIPEDKNSQKINIYNRVITGSGVGKPSTPKASSTKENNGSHHHYHHHTTSSSQVSGKQQSSSSSSHHQQTASQSSTSGAAAARVQSRESKRSADSGSGGFEMFVKTQEKKKHSDVKLSSVNIDDFIKNVKDNDRTTPKNATRKQEDRRSDKSQVKGDPSKERSSISKNSGLTITTDDSSSHGVKISTKHASTTKNQLSHKAADKAIQESQSLVDHISSLKKNYDKVTMMNSPKNNTISSGTFNKTLTMHNNYLHEENNNHKDIKHILKTSATSKSNIKQSAEQKGIFQPFKGAHAATPTSHSSKQVTRVSQSMNYSDKYNHEEQQHHHQQYQVATPSHHSSKPMTTKHSNRTKIEYNENSSSSSHHKTDSTSSNRVSQNRNSQQPPTPTHQQRPSSSHSRASKENPNVSSSAHLKKKSEKLEHHQYTKSSSSVKSSGSSGLQVSHEYNIQGRDSKSSSSQARSQETRVQKPATPSASSGGGLKDFITQVNPGMNIPSSTKNQKTTQITMDVHPHSTKNSTSRGGIDSKLSTLSPNQQQIGRPPSTTTNSSGKSFNFDNTQQQKPSSTKQTNKIFSLAEERSPSAKEARQLQQQTLINPRGPIQYFMASLEKYVKDPYYGDEYFSKIYREHFTQSFSAITFCKNLKPVDPKELAKRKVYLNKKECYKDKKTMVFDLDETLIHCNENVSMPCDVILPIKFPHGEVIEAGINVRPYAVECLRELSKYFEIIIFTASHSCYANVVLDYLDPENKYIQHRLFRENCVQTEEGLYIKDMRVFANRNLKDIIIVDNACYSFGYQLDNGVPIVPFYYNKADTELQTLVPYLKSLGPARDVRDVNSRSFKLHLITESDSHEEAIHKMFDM